MLKTSIFNYSTKHLCGKKHIKMSNSVIFTKLNSYFHFNLLYKGESVCVCVCPAACRRTYTTNHFEIWHGLLISPWLGTEPGGDPKCWPPGLPPIVTPSENPWRVKNWAGASKQKLLLGVGLPCNILFVGGTPKPGARRVHPTKWGCML